MYKRIRLWIHVHALIKIYFSFWNSCFMTGFVQQFQWKWGWTEHNLEDCHSNICLGFVSCRPLHGRDSVAEEVHHRVTWLTLTWRHVIYFSKFLLTCYLLCLLKCCCISYGGFLFCSCILFKFLFWISMWCCLF